MTSWARVNGTDIIVEYGISQMNKEMSTLSTDQENFARMVFRDLLQMKISFIDAISQFTRCNLPYGPVKSVNSILEEAHIIKHSPPIFPKAHADKPKGNQNRIPRWTSYEDIRLLAGVLLYGDERWPEIASFAAIGRDKVQCRQRYIRSLNPNISKSIWTPEEDELLLKVVSGMERIPWTQVARIMKNRNDVQCRYHYAHLMEKRQNSRPPVIKSIEDSFSLMHKRHEISDPFDPRSVSLFLGCFQKVDA